MGFYIFAKNEYKVSAWLSLLGRSAFMLKRKLSLRLPEVMESFSKPFLGVELRYE